MSIHDHRFQISIELAGVNPAMLASVLQGLTPAWHIDPVPSAPRRARLVAPPLGYGEIAMLQDVVRAVRRLGARVDETTPMELCVDASRIDARATRNLEALLAKQAELLARVFGRSIDRLGFQRVKGEPFGKGAIAISLAATLHTGELAAAIVLALAIVERALTARAASSKPRPFDATGARYDFRCFLLRLGLIGEEFRDAREQLLKRLPGSAAWKSGRPPRATADRAAVGAHDFP